MKLFGYTVYGSSEAEGAEKGGKAEGEGTEKGRKAEGEGTEKGGKADGGRMMLLKNVVIGGGLGVASGYSYHKYTQMASVGFGVGFFATQMKKRVWKYLDLNGDGKVDLEDVEVIEDKLDFQITLVGVGAFACGFGGGYLVGFW